LDRERKSRPTSGPKVAALIPALDASATLCEVLGRAKPLVDAVVVVDDGSKDETFSVASRFCDKVIRHERNLGKGAALRSGFAWLRQRGFDAVVTLDADGQHSPDDIPSFLSRYSGGSCDLVVGQREVSLRRMPLARVLANRFSSLLVSLACRRKIADSQCGFRLYALQWLPPDGPTSNRYEAETELLLEMCRKGARIGFVRIPTVYRAEVASHFRPFRDSIRVLGTIVGFALGTAFRSGPISR